MVSRQLNKVHAFAKGKTRARRHGLLCDDMANLAVGSGQALIQAAGIARLE
jgi:hypothetical protein